MVANAYYQLHTDVLKAIITNYQGGNINESIIDILDEYYSYDLEDRIPGAPIDLPFKSTRVKYNLPLRADSTFLEADWFCPTLFSQFSLKDLTKLLSAVLLEKTIVFVGDY